MECILARLELMQIKNDNYGTGDDPKRVVAVGGLRPGAKDRELAEKVVAANQMLGVALLGCPWA
jgi:hypothetical protein